MANCSVVRDERTTPIDEEIIILKLSTTASRIDFDATLKSFLNTVFGRLTTA